MGTKRDGSLDLREDEEKEGRNKCREMAGKDTDCDKLEEEEDGGEVLVDG